VCYPNKNSAFQNRTSTQPPISSVVQDVHVPYLGNQIRISSPYGPVSEHAPPGAMITIASARSALKFRWQSSSVPASPRDPFEKVNLLRPHCLLNLTSRGSLHAPVRFSGRKCDDIHDAA